MVLDVFRTGTKALDAIIDFLLMAMASPRSGVLGTFMETNYSLVGWTLPGTASPRIGFLLTVSKDEETGVPLLSTAKMELLDLRLMQWEAEASSLCTVQAVHLHSCTISLLLVSLFV